MIAQEGIELENAKDLRKGLDQAICTAEAYVAPEVVILVDWDKVVDGEISDIPLPDEVKVPGSIPQSEVADWLSDNFGFCVKGWTFKES